ncbi:PocR ligand-binding domain-containing protein [Thermovibrio ammonificans]
MELTVRPLADFFKPEEVGRHLQKFFAHIGGSSTVWDEKGELKFVDFVSPYCEVIYSKVPHRCEADRKERFEKALKIGRPFLHRCFAQKLNYVIPLVIEEKFFIGVGGG